MGWLILIWLLCKHKQLEPITMNNINKNNNSFESKQNYYSCSQLPPALGVFRWFLSQFWINFHEILQALFSTIPAPTLKISWNLNEYFNN